MKVIVAILAFTVLFVPYSNNKSYTTQDPLEKSIKRGTEVYEDFCITCHMGNGEGVENVYPPLAKSDFLIKNREASIHGIKFGQQGKIVVNGKTYNGVMAAMGLGDDEIADVMNYILNSWGNSCEKMVTEDEVASIKK